MTLATVAVIAFLVGFAWGCAAGQAMAERPPRKAARMTWTEGTGADGHPALLLTEQWDFTGERDPE